MFGRAGARGGARGGGRGGEGFSMPGPDRHYSLTIDFATAANGGKQRLSLSPDQWLDVTIPPGIEQGQVLRLKGKGGPGLGGGPAGDALIEIHIAPHPFFRREGDDIHVELPVSLAEAVLGARVPVPTVTGPVTMTIPKGSDTGAQLRLRGKGIHRKRRGAETSGDQYVTLKVVIGASDDPELTRFLEDWAKQHPTDPRREMGQGAPHGAAA
jgi:DnaJ-class molecular chaperone